MHSFTHTSLAYVDTPSALHAYPLTLSFTRPSFDFHTVPYLLSTRHVLQTRSSSR